MSVASASAPEPLAVTAPQDAAAFQLALAAPASAMDDLLRYRDALELWNGRMNLVGPSALASFWTRHAFDSAQLLARQPRASGWISAPAAAFQGWC